MSSDYIEMSGVVEAVLPSSKFKVKITDEEGNSKVLTAIISGKIRKNFIKIQVGDIVKVDISVYDLNLCRIKYREKLLPKVESQKSSSGYFGKKGKK